MSAGFICQCAQDSLTTEADHGSYGPSLRNDYLADFVGQGAGCQNIYLNAQEVAQLVADSTQIEQSSFRSCVYEDVQITFVCVRPVYNRTKYACIGRPVCQDYFANFFAMGCKCF